MTDEATQPISDTDLAAELGAALQGDSAPPAIPELETGAPAPISSADVAGDQAKPPTAPDSSALRDRLNALREQSAPTKEDPQASELGALREAVTRLSAIQHFQASGRTPAQVLEEQNSPQTLAQQAVEEAKAARAESEQYKNRMEQLEGERQQRDIISGLKNYVQTNKDHFPLVDELDSSELVYSVMDASPELSESQATAKVESSLTDFVLRGAKLLGYVKGETPGKATESGEATESPTLGPAGSGTSVTPGWDDMSDDERDRELTRQLKTALNAG